MPLANSSLALTADAISAAIEAAITDIRVIVDTPSGAKTTAEATPTVHHLNVFFYRVAPSGFHAAQTPGDPHFLRLSALLTPFPRRTIVEGEEHPSLRILGEVIRHFHENPISAVLATPQGITSYHLQTTLMAPTMEELNHIWTTQGSDLSYQMSAAYEFSLLPVDPRVAAPPAPPVSTGLLEVQQMDDAQAPLGDPLAFSTDETP